MRRLGFLCVLCCLIACTACAGDTFSDVEMESTEGIGWIALSEPVTITITAIGDVTLGGNMVTNPKTNFYTKALAGLSGDVTRFFANVRDLFEVDDLTLVNFEGCLTDIAKPATNNEFAFRAPADHILALTSASIEAVTIENNHALDFGEAGRQDTIQALSNAGIVYTARDHVGVVEISGVTIALLSYQTFNGAYPTLFEVVPLDIAAAKNVYDLVIVNIHWGNELDYAPNANQQKLGHLAIDAGADLVLGHHSHRINPIERYKDRLIVYSLANASFSGNAQPSDMDTFIFQQRFTVTPNTSTAGAFRVIPASISSVTGASSAKSGTNDLCLTPFAVDSKGFARVLTTLEKNGQSLPFAVEGYPTEWPEE